jgi:hypothetical protein
VNPAPARTPYERPSWQKGPHLVGSACPAATVNAEPNQPKEDRTREEKGDLWLSGGSSWPPPAAGQAGRAQTFWRRGGAM